MCNPNEAVSEQDGKIRHVHSTRFVRTKTSAIATGFRMGIRIRAEGLGFRGAGFGVWGVWVQDPDFWSVGFRGSRLGVWG